jgi:hypothetical protein
LWDLAAGKEIQTISGEGFNCVAFAPDGKTVATGNADTTVLIWEASSVPLAKRELTNTELARLWNELGSDDAVKANRALWSLVAGQKHAVTFLAEKLPPVPRDPKLPQRLAKLIGDLDSDEFEVRQSASAELAKLGALAEPALKAALAAKPSLEVRLRIELLLQKNEWPGMPLQDWRALAVLERLGSEDARRVLQELAKGEPGARLTQEAKEALERLQRRIGGTAKQ